MRACLSPLGSHDCLLARLSKLTYIKSSIASGWETANPVRWEHSLATVAYLLCLFLLPGVAWEELGSLMLFAQVSEPAGAGLCAEPHLPQHCLEGMHACTAI